MDFCGRRLRKTTGSWLIGLICVWLLDAVVAVVLEKTSNFQTKSMGMSSNSSYLTLVLTAMVY